MLNPSLNELKLIAKSIGDKDKNLSIQEYIDIIRSHLSDIINNHKTQAELKIHSGNITSDHKTYGEWKTFLKIIINFISSKDFDET